MAGYIKLYRNIQKHWTWTDKPYDKARAWIDICLSASYHDSKVMAGGVLVKIPRGSWFTSIRSLQKRWGWGERKTRAFLQALVQDEMLTLTTTPRGTVLTLVNYEKYQGLNGADADTDAGTHAGTNADGDADGDAGTDAVHSKNIKKLEEGKKKKGFSMLRKCTWSEEEIARYMKEVEDGKNPFGSQEVEDEYFRVALDKQHERGIY